MTLPAEPAAIVELRAITKHFPGVLANDRVDLAFRPGEVHVLLGENGAGKSTLVAILSGLVRPDSGELRVDGRARALEAPRDALALGIASVYQDVTLAPTLTVAGNLALGAPWWRKVRRRDVVQRLATLREAFGIAVHPDARVAELSLGEQQQVEIARALAGGARVLLLDEATSMLTPDEAARLGALLRRLAGEGVAVVFISHKLREALAFGDRITVLRAGRIVGTLPPGRLRAIGEAAATREIVTLMFGEARDEAPTASGRTPTAPPSGQGLSVTGLDVDGGHPVRGVSFEVAPGEILGLAGIDGNGQKELAEALAGQRPARAGGIRLGGRPIARLGVAARRRLGLRYLSDDRRGEGTVGAFPVAINLLLKDIGAPPFWRHGVQRDAPIRAHAERLVRAFDVRTPSVETPLARLSGGNVQKVVLARELSGPARAVVYAKPTHGLDLHNTEAVRRRIVEAAGAGVATLLISTDLDELLEISDRVAVMSAGRIVGIVTNDAAARERIARLMVGANAA